MRTRPRPKQRSRGKATALRDLVLLRNQLEPFATAAAKMPPSVPNTDWIWLRGHAGVRAVDCRLVVIAFQFVDNEIARRSTRQQGASK